jgi:GNAT superfamily N-acetyltransferase
MNPKPQTRNLKPMHLHLTLTAPPADSFRAAQVVGMFDLPPEEPARIEIDVEVPSLHDPWRIGAIVGPSGAGKTTVARTAFGLPSRSPRWPSDRPILDAFRPMPLRQLLAYFSAVGLHSPPAWLRPYRLLSTGERFRCDLARRLADAERLDARGFRRAGKPVLRSAHQAAARINFAARIAHHGGWGPEPTAQVLVVDEFTSHLDRHTAIAASRCLHRYARRASDVGCPHLGDRRVVPPRIVAVTCHEDILPWLGPDWVLRLPEGLLTAGPTEPPPLPLTIQLCSRDEWELFRPHHYLSGELAQGATCYLALWDNHPAALCAVLGQIGHPGRKRITRLVTLPQFQGLGIGMRLAEHVCSLESERGFRMSIATSHPAVIDGCRRSCRWRCLGIKRCGGTRQTIRGRPLAGSTGRIVAAFEFTGKGSGFGVQGSGDKPDPETRNSKL